jgi:hypothetical protein
MVAAVATAVQGMCIACVNVEHMSKMIQIRNVPDELHAKLKMRAAANGLSLSEYLLQDIRTRAEIPTLEELDQRLRRRRPVNLGGLPTRIIREHRDAGQ